mmetsp:Transcript_20091/g.42033  ORF Transcript_20091/g.42033 Transcript_20091/m.42033 type:complete len:895 (-) Transcript_20091:240-2924(-)
MIVVPFGLIRFNRKKTRTMKTREKRLRHLNLSPSPRVVKQKKNPLRINCHGPWWWNNTPRRRKIPFGNGPLQGPKCANNNSNNNNNQKEDATTTPVNNGNKENSNLTSAGWFLQQATSQLGSSSPFGLFEKWSSSQALENNDNAACRRTTSTTTTMDVEGGGTTTTTTTTVSVGTWGESLSFWHNGLLGSAASGTGGDGRKDEGEEEEADSVNGNNKFRLDPSTMQVLQESRQTPQQQQNERPVVQGYGSSIVLTEEEQELFSLLRRVRKDTNLDTTLRVAGGWVRDKLLATPEFNTYHAVFEVAGKRLTSKFRISTAQRRQQQQPQQPSLGRLGTKILTANEATQKPVDIDIALDDMLGREFAEHLNDYLSAQGEETHSVGVVLKNPEKSKHLETATMKVGTFWIDFVNLRAEEYTQDSRIPDLMRIGTAAEDALRRDLTINALFYNINTGEVEDWTGRGFDDLRKGIVATPLPPLTTLLDDPLRVLRSVRFAARLRFTMDPELVAAAQDVRVRTALAQKVSRERVGGEVELMLRSPDPVGAMRLLLHLNLIETVFPHMNYHHGEQGLSLLSTAHDHLADCKWSPPIWCQQLKNCEKSTPGNGDGLRLLEDEEARRLLWYTSFLKPLWDFVQDQQQQESIQNQKLPVRQSKKQKRKLSPVKRLLVDELKRPARDAEAIEKILKAADEISELMEQGGATVSATMVLLSDIHVRLEDVEPTNGDDSTRAPPQLVPMMNGRRVNPINEEDPVWTHAMEFRLTCFKMMQRIGPLWRAALILSLSEELNTLQANEDSLEYAIEGDIVDESQEERRRGIIEKYDIFAAALLRLGLIGCWDMKPLLDGGAIKQGGILPLIPKGPAFRDVMEEQSDWMAMHPGADAAALESHLKQMFPDFA